MKYYAPTFLNGISSLILVLKHYLEEVVIDVADQTDNFNYKIDDYCYCSNDGMSVGTMGQDIKRIDRHRNKHVEYPCGCRYLFDHHIVLERICTEHENELIAHHG
jgi:hypothetical protein